MPKQRFSSYATKLTVQWASLWRTRMHCKILSAVIVLGTVVMTSLTHAQSKQFKVELYNRGLEHLRKIKSPDIFQLDNAFESAASVDSKTLLDPLLEEFHFKSHSLLDQIAQHADLIEPAQALNWLRKQNFDWTDNATIADLAFKFGTQQANLDQLIDSLGDFIVKDEDGIVPDDDATQAKLRESRIEELHYVYNLGSLGSNAPLKPIEHFHQGISCPILKKHLHAVWLARIAPQIMSLEEISESIQKMEPQHLASGALSSALVKMDKEQLATDKVRMMVSVLLKSHLADQAADTKKFEFEFESARKLSSIIPFSPTPTRSDILRLVRKSEFKTEDLHRFAPEDNGVAEFFATIPAERSSTNSPVTANEKIETDFENKLADISWERQPSWIVDFVLHFGWGNRHIDPANFPDEDKILAAFKLRIGDDPVIAEKLERCQGSFTPATDASKIVLNKLMKMLPEEEQLLTRFDIDSLSTRIQQSKEPDFDLLLKEVLLQMNRPERSKEKLAAKFAFEFAKVGAKSNVVDLLERIKDQEEKTWAYFQCAIAFPPRTVRPEPIQYSRRVDGGVF